MSNIYNTEPPTSGKVICRTQFGDIDIELWSKEAPLACRNFIQLALEGYYDNMYVHRIIKDFMLQTGDPTGTGTGGDSIWGRPFKDETHGRIKFNHRGQVAMANSNIPNSNRSQFFITLGPCEWLNRKHTIFGKVTGNTIYNLMRINEVEVNTEDSDRPVDLNEVKIKTIEVVWNPFDDIVPRATSLRNAAATAESNVHVPKSKGKKDKKLLSFEESEDESGEEGDVCTIRRTENRTNLSAVECEKADEEALTCKAVVINSKNSHAGTGVPSVKSVASSESITVLSNTTTGVKPMEKQKIENVSVPLETTPTPVPESTPIINAASILKKELLASRRAVKLLNNPEDTKTMSTNADNRHDGDLSLVEQRRLKYKTMKKIHGNREAETLNKLGLFKQNLLQQKRKYNEAGEGDSSNPSNIENEEDGDWYAGKLKFTKHQDDAYRNKV